MSLAGLRSSISTGTSWKNVVTGYARLSNDKLRVADVQSLLGKLNVKSSSRAELIRRVVAALHKNVRYTGVEFGEASIVPQFPSETLKRKYGDCKDKAALLVTVLRALNIPANLALLSTGPGQDINPELPGMGMFDHAIVFVPHPVPNRNYGSTQPPNIHVRVISPGWIMAAGRWLLKKRRTQEDFRIYSGTEFSPRSS